MNNSSGVRDLVEWQVFQTVIVDPATRVFALDLCKLFTDARGSIEYTDAELAILFNLSKGSVLKYAQTLEASGEWNIVSVRGVGRTYAPLF